MCIGGSTVRAAYKRSLRTGLYWRLSPEERGWLAEAVEDPDTLFARERLPLIDKLVELNLIVDSIEGRESWYWVDEPPPERDSELGVGWHVAW